MTDTPSTMDRRSPAELLEGLDLPNGWRVKERVRRPLEATGGFFSVGYIASNPTRPDGFLKAIDFSRALRSTDPAGQLLQQTMAFVFERDLCLALASRRLDHIVVAIDHGTVDVACGGSTQKVQYIIFELAAGDIRHRLDEIERISTSLPLRVLHNVAVGLRQLHSAGAAHQDIKPSNVLEFENRLAKLADFGRASARGLASSSPFDGLTIPGDRGYAPPELLYAQPPSDWNERRQGCDLYLFGSLVHYVYTRSNMTGELLSRLPEEYHPHQWHGDYATVLPFLRDAFSRVIEDVRIAMPPGIADDLTDMIRQLCDPDPSMRGHPSQRGPNYNRLSLDRYVTKLDLLSTRASIMSSRSK